MTPEEDCMDIQWKTDVDQALAESKKSGKPLILDFTAAPM
jgi:thiol:disulfide interchange protein